MTMSQTMIPVGIFAMFVITLCLGGPVHKRSTTNNVVEFTMDNSIAKDDELEAIGFESKELSDQINCSADVSTEETDPLYKRSTCPWYYEAQYNASYFPATILEARPVCKYCLGSNNKHECAAIYQELVVLKQADEDTSIWRQTTKNIIVGFTCTGRRIGDNQAPSQPGSTALPPVNYDDDYA